MRRNVEETHCLLDLNYSSQLLSSKIADIPQKLKYETILVPLFEYCFGTSDQDEVLSIPYDDDEEEFSNDQKFVVEYNDKSSKIDWIRDETFLLSQIFTLFAEKKVAIIATKFGLWNKRQFIYQARYHMHNYFYLNEQFRNDRELIMEIVKEIGCNLQYASDALKNDKEIVMQAVKQNGDALKFASEELKDDKEFVLSVLERLRLHGLYIYISERLKNDRDVVLRAVSYGLPIYMASEEFNKNDREIILIASKNGPRYGFNALEFASSELRNDKEIVLNVIRHHKYRTFEYASDELKKDREFVKEIVMINGKCLVYAKEFHNDKEIVELALKSSPDVIDILSESFKNDHAELISNAIGKRGFKNLPTEFSNDIEIVLNSIKINENNLQRASMELQNSREFILQAVEHNGLAFADVNEEFKSDREIILKAVSQNVYTLQSVPVQYFDDEEIMIKAGHSYFEDHVYLDAYKLSDRLKNDRGFLMKCGAWLEFLPRKYRLDREIVMEIVKTHPKSAYGLCVYDRVIAMRMVKKDGLLLRNLSAKYQNDRELVSFAIQQNKKAFKFASDALQNDLEILKLYNCHC